MRLKSTEKFPNIYRLLTAVGWEEMSLYDTIRSWILYPSVI